MKTGDPYKTALEASAIALHWLAHTWESFSPSVALHMRRIADNLHARAKALRHPIFDPEEEVTPTEVRTQLYGVPPTTPPSKP